MMEKLLVKICFNLLLVDAREKSLGGSGSLWSAEKRILGLCNVCYVMLEGETKMGKEEFEEEEASMVK